MLDNFGILGWDDVPFIKYIDIISIQEDSVFKRNLELITILTDSDEWDDLPTKKITEVINSNKWLSSKPNSNHKNKIDEWTLKPFNKFTLAEWIDLEKYILERKYENLIALCYRKTKQDEWGNIIYEPYLYNCSERSDVFLDYPVTYLFGVIESAIKYRDSLLNSFYELFESIEESDFEPDNDELTYMTEAEIIELKQQIKKDNEKKFYSWQKLLDDISGGNWSYIEEILNLPVVFVFNMMMMKKKYNQT